MKLLDPLQGYKIASSVIFLQLAFTLAMVVLIDKGEIELVNRDYSLALMFLVHVWCYFFEYLAVLIDLCKVDLGIVKSTLTFVNAAAYQGAVFYAQVKYVNASYDSVKEHTQEEELMNIRCKQWLMLEISFYYTSIGLTVLFLALHSLFGLEISTPISQIEKYEKQSNLENQTAINDETKEGQNLLKDTENDEVKNEGQEANFQNKIEEDYDSNDFWHPEQQSKDFLELTTDNLKYFLNHGIICVFSLLVLVKGYSPKEDKNYSYSVIILAVLSGILFFHVILDLFTKINKPKWFNVTGYIIVGGILIDVVYMIVQISMFEQSENLVRYWILIFIFIILAYLISFGFTLIAKKMQRFSYMFSGDSNEQTQKKTLSQPFMTHITFSVDIYSIAFVSFYKLDEKIPRVDVNNDESFLKQSRQKLLTSWVNRGQSQSQNEEMIVSNSEANANKYFSTCAFIFIVQLLLILLVVYDIAVFDLPSVTVPVFLTRITCAALLHMQLEGEIRQAIQMFNYARVMVYQRKYRIAMLLISLMQVVSAFATELLSILLICNQDSVSNVLMNFIALGVIAEIDDIYARSLYQNNIKEEIESGFTLTIREDQPVRQQYKRRCRIEFILYKIWRFLFEIYYYYFMPFTVIAITYFKEIMDTNAIEEQINQVLQNIQSQ
ncbi:UNKNOWN [Stylonychia lemnae]|uniref:Transmembrane protein n=1 Tax=Stylonychia lemnae TaxID=5949 RepID=A0A078A4Z0_STYLE|nr:UNKNOWN [Stylonychia lemnae]|eukprot:CDW76919.1 UNKNOWN [Stylonychia lemnae]